MFVWCPWNDLLFCRVFPVVSHAIWPNSKAGLCIHWSLPLTMTCTSLSKNEKKEKKFWDSASAAAAASDLKSTPISEVRREVVSAVTKDTSFSSPWCDVYVLLVGQLHVACKSDDSWMRRPFTRRIMSLSQNCIKSESKISSEDSRMYSPWFIKNMCMRVCVYCQIFIHHSSEVYKTYETSIATLHQYIFIFITWLIIPKLTYSRCT